MIFAPVLAQRILDGKKTVTRRRLTHRGGRELRYKVGGVYAIQPGRGKRHIGHIRVTQVSAEPLGMLDDHGEGWNAGEVLAEGFASLEAFQRYWAVLHGEYDPEELVARISFEVWPGNGCCS